jgi:hypothetical protein
LVGQLTIAFQIGLEFNVIKFRTDEFKVSFLAYPAFFDDAHPALLKALTLDLVTGKMRCTEYAGVLEKLGLNENLKQAPGTSGTMDEEPLGKVDDALWRVAI